MKERCKVCGGKRHIMQLGGIKKECQNCKGAGWVDVVEKMEGKCKDKGGKGGGTRKR